IVRRPTGPDKLDLADGVVDNDARGSFRQAPAAAIPGGGATVAASSKSIRYPQGGRRWREADDRQRRDPSGSPSDATPPGGGSRRTRQPRPPRSRRSPQSG